MCSAPEHRSIAVMDESVSDVSDVDQCLQSGVLTTRREVSRCQLTTCCPGHTRWQHALTQYNRVVSTQCSRPRGPSFFSGRNPAGPQLKFYHNPAHSKCCLLELSRYLCTTTLQR